MTVQHTIRTAHAHDHNDGLLFFGRALTKSNMRIRVNAAPMTVIFTCSLFLKLGLWKLTSIDTQNATRKWNCGNILTTTTVEPPSPPVPVHRRGEVTDSTALLLTRG